MHRRSLIFSLPEQSKEELLHYPRRLLVSVLGLATCSSFYVKDYYVMGNELTGELSCPCDGSCYVL